MASPARPLLAAAALVLAAASACGSTTAGSGGAGSDTTRSMPTTTAPSSEAPPAPSPTGSASALPVPAEVLGRPAVKAAVADAAKREGVGADEVVLAAFTPVTWSDGSLGCPQPGMAYTQATVEGELLLLRVGTALLQYHGRVGGPFAYCADPTSGYTVG